MSTTGTGSTEGRPDTAPNASVSHGQRPGPSAHESDEQDPRGEDDGGVTTGGASIVVEPWDRRRDRRTAALLFLCALVVFLLTADYGNYQMNDTRAASQSAWSLGTRGTLALPEQWRGDIDWEVEAADGNLYTNRFPGPILWAAPFYGAWDLVASEDVPPHPLNLNYVPAAVASAVAVALGVMVSFVVHRRLANRRLAVGATVALAFGTGVWSVASGALWTHTLTYVTLVLGVLAAADNRNARSGLAFAGAILSRPQVAVIPAVVGLWSGISQRRLRPIITMGATSALGLLAVMLYSRVYFATAMPVAGYDDYAVQNLTGTGMRDFVVNITAALAFPYRGVIVFTPILIVLVPFLRRGWRASPWWVRASAVAGLLYVLLQLRLNVWHGGRGFFGSRLTIEMLVLASPLFLRTWQVFHAHRPTFRRVGIALAGGAIVLHALGATIWAYDAGLGGPESRERFGSRMAEVCEADPSRRGC